jgi:hypothetical protein
MDLLSIIFILICVSLAFVAAFLALADGDLSLMCIEKFGKKVGMIWPLLFVIVWQNAFSAQAYC